MTSKRIMVDMSATIIHPGHIRLLKKAKQLGTVIVALTTDEEVYMKKGYYPELTYEERKEILLAIKYVDEVVPSLWMLTEEYLNEHNIDKLVHGDDNVNPIDPNRLVIFPRTEGISSKTLRQKSYEIVHNSISQRS